LVGFFLKSLSLSLKPITYYIIRTRCIHRAADIILAELALLTDYPLAVKITETLWK
jgi:hypothetical protein